MDTKIRQIVFAADVAALKEKLEQELEESKKLTVGFDGCEGDYYNGKEAEMSAVIEELGKLLDKRLRVEYKEAKFA